MPRTCLACASPERAAIDKALVAGEPLRNISKRVSISPAGLLRHKSHVAGSIVKAQERREEKLGDSIFDQIRRLQAKALELLAKMESEGDYRGAIVALREARECLVSANGLLLKAEGGTGIKIEVTMVGGDDGAAAKPADKAAAKSRAAAVPVIASTMDYKDQPQQHENAVGPAALPQEPQASTGFAILPPAQQPRRFLTRTGASMAFLRGGGSR